MGEGGAEGGKGHGTVLKEGIKEPSGDGAGHGVVEQKRRQS